MRLEPTAKVTVCTSKGDIDIDLYAKELPKSCRAFLQNCLSKRYNGLQFDTASASFIQSQKLDDKSEIQYESHSRLKFDGRGCLGLLSHENSRASSADGFFIALKPPSELHTSHVYIGEVVGDSIYNALKIADVEKKEGTDEPLYPVLIRDTVVHTPYFEDLQIEPLAQDPTSHKKKRQKKSLKLDFGDDESDAVVDFQMKSAHEALRRSKPAPTPTTQKNASPQKSTKLDQKKKDLIEDRYKAYLDLSDDNLDDKALEAHEYNPVKDNILQDYKPLDKFNPIK